MKKIISLTLIIISVSSCADIIDIYYLKNRDKRDKNVVKGTKEDMLKQMKSVRNIPSSISNKNTVQTEINHEDAVFEALKDVDSGLDNIFG